MNEELEKNTRPTARERPGWVAIYYAYRAAAGLLLAAPLALEIGSLLSRAPRGDGVLFDPGAVLLVEVVQKTLPALPALAAGAGLSLLVAAFLGLIPLTGLLVALGHRGPLPLGRVAERAGGSLGTLSVLWGLALFAQLCVGGILYVVLGRIATSLDWAAPRGDIARAVAMVLTALAVLGIGAVHDLARVAAVDGRRHVYAASARAFALVRAAPVRVFASYGARAAAAGLVLVLGAVVASRIGYAALQPAALSLLVHQAALFVAVSLRASWLAAAMRFERAATDIC